jgi:hypothetical protein
LFSTLDIYQVSTLLSEGTTPAVTCGADVYKTLLDEEGISWCANRDEIEGKVKKPSTGLHRPKKFKRKG